MIAQEQANKADDSKKTETEVTNWTKIQAKLTRGLNASGDDGWGGAMIMII